MKLISFLFVLSASVALASSTPTKSSKSKTKKAVVVQAPDSAEVSGNSSSASINTSDVNEERHFHLRPILGYTFLSPKEVNNFLAEGGKTIGLTDTFKISGAPMISAAADYSVIPQLSLGARVDYFSASTDSVTSKNVLTAQASLSALPVYATVTFSQPVMEKVSLGLMAGAGMPVFFRHSFEFSGSQNDNYPNGTLTYSSNPFSGFGTAFVNYDFTNRIALRAEGGYRYLASNQMKATSNYGKNNAIKDGALFKDSSDRNINVDASAVNIGLSLALSM